VLRRAAGVVALLLATAMIAACGDDGESAADTTTTARPTTTSSTTTTEPDDPWAVPDDIDEAYVQRVLTELYRLDGEATRLAISEGVVTDQVIELVRHVFVDELAAAHLNALVEDAHAGFPGYVDPPGDASVQLVELLAASRSCVSVVIELDFSPMVVSPTARPLSYVVLRPASAGNAPGWRINWLEVVERREIPHEADQCSTS
jgi:hypothetical protein